VRCGISACKSTEFADARGTVGAYDRWKRRMSISATPGSRRAAKAASIALVMVLAVSACGGSSPSEPATGGGPGSGGQPTRAQLARRALTGYLRAAATANGSAGARVPVMIAELRDVAGHPSAAGIAAAARSTRTGAETVRVAARAVASMRPSLIPARAQQPLVRWSGRTARGLRKVARGLDDWPFAEAATGRRMLRRAADAALAWEGAMRRLAVRRGAQLPGWVPAQTRRAQALAHAADVLFKPVRLAAGATGAPVRALQQRLAALGYLPPGYGSGAYDYATMQAATAFQGWEGIARDGVAGPLTLRALHTADRPVPWSRDSRHMEVHKAQQVLLLVDGGRVVRAIHVSTAAPGHVTPDGTFAIYRKERMSWSVPFQVWMPYASYFTGGYALHEYPDVPPYPASHGCVRVPMWVAPRLFEADGYGTTVYVY
jgi:hypothetical protein